MSQFQLCTILVPRAHDPSGLRQGSRALAGSKPGSPWNTDFRFFHANSEVWNNSGCHRLQKCTFTATAHISELARALDPRRIVGSGDENGYALVIASPNRHRTRQFLVFSWRHKFMQIRFPPCWCPCEVWNWFSRTNVSALNFLYIFF